MKDIRIILFLTLIVVLLDYSAGVDMEPDAVATLRSAGFPDECIEPMLKTTSRMLGSPDELLRKELIGQENKLFDILRPQVNHGKTNFVKKEGQSSTSFSNLVVVTKRETEDESYPSGSKTSRVHRVTEPIKVCKRSYRKRQFGEISTIQHQYWIQKASTETGMKMRHVIELDGKLPYLDTERYADYPDLAAVPGTSRNFKELRTLQKIKVKFLNKLRAKFQGGSRKNGKRAVKDDLSLI